MHAAMPQHALPHTVQRPPSCRSELACLLCASDLASMEDCSAARQCDVRRGRCYHLAVCGSSTEAVAPDCAVSLAALSSSAAPSSFSTKGRFSASSGSASLQVCQPASMVSSCIWCQCSRQLFNNIISSKHSRVPMPAGGARLALGAPGQVQDCMRSVLLGNLKFAEAN